MLTKSAKNSKKGPTFAQRVGERMQEENQWQQYNGEAGFLPEIEKSLAMLAEKTFPTDIANRHAYQEAIVKSLTQTLNPEIGIKTFWTKMAEIGCKTLRIENGHLNFYSAKNTRIDITPYTQPIVFEAHSSYYDQRLLERKERIGEAKKELQQLLAEINKSHK